MTTTWYVPARILRALGWPVRRVQQFIVTMTPRLRQYAPIVHEGASEGYGRELRALRSAPLDPALSLKPAQQMNVDHECLSAISTAVDEFGQAVLGALGEFLRDLPEVLLEVTRERPAVAA